MTIYEYENVNKAKQNGLPLCKCGCCGTIMAYETKDIKKVSQKLTPELYDKSGILNKWYEKGYLKCPMCKNKQPIINNVT